MSRKTITVTVRMEPELADAISDVCDNRNAFIVEAIKEKLAPVPPLSPDELPEATLTDTEKRGVLKGAKNLNDMLQDAILAEASRRKNFLASMDNDSFAKLVASRLPKEAAEDTDLDRDLLSLRACLAELPETSDLTAELAKLRGALFKAEHERDMNLALLKHAKGKAELAEVMNLVYRGAVEYAVDLVARHSLPGFGDGGGIPATEYEAISRQVKKELEGLKLYGVK